MFETPSPIERRLLLEADSAPDAPDAEGAEFAFVQRGGPESGVVHRAASLAAVLRFMAELFNVDERTVRRRWAAACALLAERLGGELPGM